MNNQVSFCICSAYLSHLLSWKDIIITEINASVKLLASDTIILKWRAREMTEGLFRDYVQWVMTACVRSMTN